ncbi:MAG TPA: trypsin-like peptidase domain-containing protein [Gemmatimonadaceae bacterium]|nr:trypsin-like peptidase domain-containing protein [Gemmatimonadaceae bacterium]
MSIAIRILDGALAGRTSRFDKSVITVGRQSGNDLRFDAEKDLDVSAKHAEIHLIQGRYALHDLNSTNGTIVNGTKLPSGGTIEIRNGDRIRFGTQGPEVEFHATGAGAGAKPASTEVRIAAAVEKQTAGLKRLMVAGLVLVVAGGGVAFFYNSRASSRRIAELERIARANDSLRVELQGALAKSGDTTLMSEMRDRMASLRTRLAAATTDADRAQIRAEMQDTERMLRRFVQMDLPTIFARNAQAVAITVSEFQGRSFAGSAFGITKEGLLLTNRHNVIHPETGRRADRIAVKYTDTRDWLPARIVSVSDIEDTDLALIQMEREGRYPSVEGVSRGTEQSTEGVTVAIIGYPAGMNTPMEGEGNDFLAKSTLSSGTVSKKTSAVLQIDSYATHGSSGSPVFDAQGHVIGVVYGGQADAGGRIVYAVPAERLAAFIPEKYRAVLKD